MKKFDTGKEIVTVVDTDEKTGVHVVEFPEKGLQAITHAELLTWKEVTEPKPGPKPRLRTRTEVIERVQYVGFHTFFAGLFVGIVFMMWMGAN